MMDDMSYILVSLTLEPICHKIHYGPGTTWWLCAVLVVALKLFLDRNGLGLSGLDGEILNFISSDSDLLFSSKFHMESIF